MFKKKIYCLFLGDDNVGKTTTLFKIIGNRETIIPTVGFNVGSAQYKLPDGNCKLIFWEVGGQEKIRPLWLHYISDKDVIFLFVDFTKEADDWQTSITNCLNVIDSKGNRTQPVYVIGSKLDVVADRINVDILETYRQLENLVPQHFSSRNTYFLGYYSATIDHWRNIENNKYSGIVEAMATVGLQAKRASDALKKEERAAQRREVRLYLSNNIFKPAIACQCSPAWRNRRAKFRIGLSVMVTFGVFPLPFMLAAAVSYSFERKLEKRNGTISVTRNDYTPLK